MTNTTAAQIEMPVYKSHKRVWALKIRALDGNVIVPEEDGYASFTVSDEYLAKHQPGPGGYFVQYADGYESFSPAAAFEGGYTLLRASARKPKILTIELENQIAAVCHETNRIYCQTIGDNSQPWWTDAPDGQKQSARNRVSQLWTVLERGEEPTAEKALYDALPPEQRMKDHLFVNIVKAFFFAN